MNSDVQQSVAMSILQDAEIAEFDPLTILTIISIIIQIIMFLGKNWQDPRYLPLWKKMVIKVKLFAKFGRKKGLKLEEIIYRKVHSLTQEQVNAFVEV